MRNEDLINSITDANKREVMETLWLNNSGIIFNSVYRWSGRGIAVDDLQQEAYFALLIAVKRYKVKEGRWAFSTILTYTLDWFFIRLLNGSRYLNNESLILNSPISKDNDTNENIDLLAADIDIENDVIQELSDNETRELWAAALDTLDKNIQQVVNLKVMHNYSLTKVADILGIAPAKARVLFVTGMRRLRTNYRLINRLKSIVSDQHIYGAGLKFTSFKSFKERGASSQEVYLINKDKGNTAPHKPQSYTAAL